MENEKIVKLLEKSKFTGCPSCAAKEFCDCLIMSFVDYNKDIDKLIEGIK